MKGILTGVLLLIGVGVIGWLGYNFYIEYQRQVRNEAVDGCMTNARYVWQGTNAENPALNVTNEEPHRFWYKTCMEEKGYIINIEV